MSIEIIPINGQNFNFNYQEFEENVKSTLGRTCQNAKIFLLNKFPAAISNETNLDLILIIIIENIKGNYFISHNIENKPIYFHNQIIPIKFINTFENEKLYKTDKHQIFSDENLVDFSTEIGAVKFGLIKYFTQKCGFNFLDLFIEPIIFIRNKSEIYLNNYIVKEKFDFTTLTKYIKNLNRHIINSNKNWYSNINYSNINIEVDKITNQAQKDSEFGYLTKKKIERIALQTSKAKTIYSELNNKLIIINGKAGTGKSSELLLLKLYCINNNKNTIYLTYNKILIFEISSFINFYRNVKINSDNQVGEAYVSTLHSFFYKLSKTLGVLHIINYERIELLLSKLKERMRIIYNFISEDLQSIDFNENYLKTKIQNENKFDIGIKEVGIDFINFLKNNYFNKSSDLKKLSKEFYSSKQQILSNILPEELFIANYYGILENILEQIEKPEVFFKKYNVKDKFEILDVAIGLHKENYTEIDGKKEITQKGFNTFKNRRIGSIRRSRTLFIDEAQDCHRLEKDILISIFGASNIVVANGGKEQLIRHVELCNWNVSQGKTISVFSHPLRKKSYRIKKSLVDLCNFIANKFEVSLNIETDISEDEGELIFDFRSNHTENEILDICSILNTKGQVNGCKPYESLMIILESSTIRKTDNNKETDNNKKELIQVENNTVKVSAIINEYNNIEDSKNKSRPKWKFQSNLEKMGYSFWDGTVDDKSNLLPPSQNETRMIYYESCRGLEAYTVACFNLDKFFQIKRTEPDAEKYLIEDLFLNKENEKRKSMYAATWVLMALTRAIDTQYIHIANQESELGKVIQEYLKTDKKNIRIYR